MTDNTDDTSRAEDFVRSYAARRAEEKRSGADGLKAACAPLSKIGVTSVIWAYDGSGDSGAIESCMFYAGTNELHNVYLDALRSDLLSQTERDQIAAEQLENAVFKLLPAGFENNDGGYGEVHLDVETRTIRVEHNQRYTDAIYSEETF